jgi:hypothetical protein
MGAPRARVVPERVILDPSFKLEDPNMKSIRIGDPFSHF